ncbi:MAG: helix-turn-helix transcriptional regulator [Erysipelotrichaceae bacterium]|nr:helix-turn-helix transcriptional regulator [Erysipelotrichaceae bacterium]
MENKFGELLQTLRKEKGWTQQQLADLLHVTNKTVSKWERNEAYPETATLIELSKLFQISLDDLLNGKKPEKPVETVNVSYQNKLNEWQVVRSELLSKIMILLGLMGFFAIYFITKLFTPSIFVMSFFLVLSFSFVLMRNEKAKVFSSQDNPNETWIEWVALILACLILVVPCINFPIRLDSIVQQMEYVMGNTSEGYISPYVSGNGIVYGYTHLSFSNYLTWLPYLIALSQFVYFTICALSRKKLTRAVKMSFLALVLLFGMILGMNGLKNTMRPYKTMGESEYQAYKNRYIKITESFEIFPDSLYDIDSDVLDKEMNGKARYESFMDVAGFNDQKKRVYYDLTGEQKEYVKIITCILSLVLSIGSVFIINKKRKMPE